MFQSLVKSICMVPGATAYGLLNPESKTKARIKFLEFLNKYSDFIPISCLGEVDCNALVWKSCQNGWTARRFINKATLNYMEFIREIPNKTVVCSVIPPIVESYQSPLYLKRRSKPRSYVAAGIGTRANTVDYFNSRMERFCKTEGFWYLDFAPSVKGPNGRVKKEFIKRLDDSHLNGKIVSILENKLRTIIKQRGFNGS